MTHELKTHPEPFQDILDGKKPWEFRFNDRDFKVGDRLLLIEWDPKLEQYTGRSKLVLVTYLRDLSIYGAKSYVCMTIEAAA